MAFLAFVVHALLSGALPRPSLLALRGGDRDRDRCTQNIGVQRSGFLSYMGVNQAVLARLRFACGFRGSPNL